MISAQIRHHFKWVKLLNLVKSLSFSYQLPFASGIRMGDDLINRIKKNNDKGEELVAYLQNEISQLKEIAMQTSMRKIAADLKAENVKLKQEVELWKNKVIELEKLNGIQQSTLPSSTSVVQDDQKGSLETNASDEAKIEAAVPTEEGPKKQSKKDQKEVAKKEKPPKSQKNDAPSKEEDNEVSVSRLDLRIGRILAAKKHPDAESLYVEEIDVGDGKPRTVVSGLVKFVPLEDMQNRLVVVLCNLKPAKMRGVSSEAMVMCASTPEKVEILCPPEGSVAGDRVSCIDFPGEPDAILPPKKKIFEQVAPDLKTNDECVATYKSSPWMVVGKGFVKAATLTGVQIK